jgi:hypothetical protein
MPRDFKRSIMFQISYSFESFVTIAQISPRIPSLLIVPDFIILMLNQIPAMEEIDAFEEPCNIS